jgi:hypothetical protein
MTLRELHERLSLLIDENDRRKAGGKDADNRNDAFPLYVSVQVSKRRKTFYPVLWLDGGLCSHSARLTGMGFFIEMRADQDGSVTIAN